MLRRQPELTLYLSKSPLLRRQSQSWLSTLQNRRCSGVSPRADSLYLQKSPLLRRQLELALYLSKSPLLWRQFQSWLSIFQNRRCSGVSPRAGSLYSHKSPLLRRQSEPTLYHKIFLKVYQSFWLFFSSGTRAGVVFSLALHFLLSVIFPIPTTFFQASFTACFSYTLPFLICII